MIIDSLAKEYRCSPNEVEKLYFFDALVYFRKLKNKREQKDREKLMEYMTLIQIIHTGEPKKLLDKMSKAINNVDEDLGDLDRLSNLKPR